MTPLGATVRARAGRRRGRFLAPLALVAVIVAIVVVISAGVGKSNHPAGAARRHAVGRTVAAHRVVARSYVVQAGDSLSAISVKTKVPVPTLESLNPSVDPNALQPGQRLRLR